MYILGLVIGTLICLCLTSIVILFFNALSGVHEGKITITIVFVLAFFVFETLAVGIVNNIFGV